MSNLVDGSPYIQGATDDTLIGNVGDRLKVDVGTITSAPGETELKTYAASASGFIPPASATDVFTIYGSSTKTVKIKRISFACTTTAGSGFTSSLTLTKRSTANSGGTSSTSTVVPHDSNDPAGTATVRSYTANPTSLGTAVGAIYATRFGIGQATGSQNSNGNQIDQGVEFAIRPSKAVVLRGTNEGLCVNLGGLTITNPVMSCSVEWTEE